MVDIAAAAEGAANLASAYVDANDRQVLDPEAIGDSLLERMPEPTGWRLLILPYRGKGKTDGGIYLPDKVVEEQTVSTQVGYVLKVGALAYKDAESFRLDRGVSRAIGSCLRVMPARVFG